MDDITSLPATQILTEIISGLTISILLIPEAIAFALSLGLSPSAGIQSTMIISLISSIFGGQPGLISGASAAVATSLMGVSSFMGTEYIPFAVLIGGLIQWIIGFTGLYKLIDVMPNGVVSGFMCGLGLLILSSEIDNFKINDKNWFTGDMLAYSVLLTIIGLIIVLYGEIPGVVKIPGAFSSIIVLTLSLILLPAIKVQLVKDKGQVQSIFPSFKLPNIPEVTNKQSNGFDFLKILKILPYSLAMAVAASTETLFNLRRVGEELNNKGNSFKEIITQGICNIFCGLSNGMGGCVLGGPTRFNIANGAKTKLSTVSASIFFILFCVVFFKFIDIIPMPAIIAIMFVVAYKTGDWLAILKMPDSDWITTVTTTLSSFLSGNLALGVFIGFVCDAVIKKLKSNGRFVSAKNV
jgi:SulP family sulfate permease